LKGKLKRRMAFRPCCVATFDGSFCFAKQFGGRLRLGQI